MSFIVSAITELPLRSMVAVAARCAQRVLPIIRADFGKDSVGDFSYENLYLLVQTASNFDLNLNNPSIFEMHIPVEPGESYNDIQNGVRLPRLGYACRSCMMAYAAACAAFRGDIKTTALAASEAFTYAADAIDGVPRDPVKTYVDPALMADISRLSRAKQLWPNNELGDPIDSQDKGPMGALWPEGEPLLLTDVEAAVSMGRIIIDGVAYAEVVPGMITQVE